jgi:uncharacterized damage-inducible protein DinB
MTSAAVITANFSSYASTKLGHSLLQIEKCLNLLSVEQVWHRPNGVSNAIGNLVLHLAGNVRQWIVASLGDEPFARDRAAEFNRREPLPHEEVLGRLRETVERACRVISSLTPNQLAQRVMIQGYEVTGLEAVFHVVEHFSLHTGQIVYATKLLINQDLSQYDTAGRRLDGRTSGAP